MINHIVSFTFHYNIKIGCCIITFYNEKKFKIFLTENNLFISMPVKDAKFPIFYACNSFKRAYKPTFWNLKDVGINNKHESYLEDYLLHFMSRHLSLLCVCGTVCNSKSLYFYRNYCCELEIELYGL